MTFTPNYTPDLCTLDYVRSIRELDTEATGTDALLTHYIHAVSALIQNELQRTCMPYLDTKVYGYYTSRYIHNATTLNTRDDLLAVTSVLKGDTAVDSSAYVLLPRNRYPANVIKLKSSASITWLYTTSIDDTVSVTGEWGYAPNYERAWVTSGETLASAAGATASTLTVTDGTPFEVLQYIQVNDETMQITAIATDTLTVTRAELGTTAAAHDSGDTLEQYQQLSDLRNATAQTVGYLYKTQHQLGGRVTVFDGGMVQVNDLDPLVQQIIRRHRKFYGAAV